MNLRNKNFIYGEVRHPSGKENSYPSRIQDVISSQTFIESSLNDIDDVMRLGRGGRDFWASMSRHQRLALFNRIIEELELRKGSLAEIEADTAGKKISDAAQEVEVFLGHWRMARSLLELSSEKVFTQLEDGLTASVRHFPIGLILLIVPYNFPLVVIAERLPYMLAAGNSVIIKPSEISDASSVILAKILCEAGLPRGVVEVLQGSGAEVGEKLVLHDAISMISFTGSSRVGKKINVLCAENFKKCTLELGGNNPLIVDEDADIDVLTPALVDGFIYHAGQCCISTNNIFIHENIKDLVVKNIQEYLSTVPDESIDQIHLYEKYEELRKIIASYGEGKEYRVLWGNINQSFNSQKISPVLVEPLDRSSPSDHELFGPIGLIHSFKELNEVISRVNKTKFGLAASYWGKNPKNIELFVRRVEAGRLWINGVLKSAVQLPLGGLKSSGIGREAGYSGLENYFLKKSIMSWDKKND